MRMTKYMVFFAVFLGNTTVFAQTKCELLQQHHGYKQTLSRVIQLNDIHVIAPFDVLSGLTKTCVLVAFQIDPEGKAFGFTSAGAYPDNRLLRYAVHSLQAAAFKASDHDTAAVMYFELTADSLL